MSKGMKNLLPRTVRKNISQEWGSRGEKWLTQLPKLIDRCTKKWNLHILNLNFPLSYNYVTSALREDETEVILKIGFPHPELFTEMKALKILDGRCSVRLIESDTDLGAMLLERVSPGTTLADIQKKNDRRATEIAAVLIRDLPLSVSKGSDFPTVAEWTEVLEKTTKMIGNHGPLPLRILQKAHALFVALERSKKKDLLLHGDLHYDNILFDDKRGWVAIDPKGVIGDPTFNAARLLCNPNPALMQMDNPRKIIERRVKILASVLGAEENRLVAWAYVDCVMTACWWIESGGKTCNFSIGVAKILDAILQTYSSLVTHPHVPDRHT